MSTALRVGALALLAAVFASLPASSRASRPVRAQAPAAALTPIHHLVVIDQEGASFDHYFGSYPAAENLPGEPAFVAASNTPSVDRLTPSLMTANPNLTNPFRLDRAQAATCSQSSRYDDEQRAYNGGGADRFVESTGSQPSGTTLYCPQDTSGHYEAVMGYFDGNAVTALWNYAQHFALGDNYVGTTFGQSTLGAVHLVSGDTSGVLCAPQSSAYGAQPVCGPPGTPAPSSTAASAPSSGATGTLVFDGNPFWDTCASSDAAARVALSGLTIGDLLDGAGVSWGWFQGGFAPSPGGACDSQHVREAYDAAAVIDPSGDSGASNDYSAAREPFQFYASTANPTHLPPDSVATVGHDDAANHQYDLSWFWQAAESDNLPAVSFLKAPAYQAGRAGASDPLDEQRFLVDTINRLQQLPQWKDMAIVVTWDDSGGWYDHVAPRTVNQSSTPLDFACGNASAGEPARCAYGPRLPILAISPFAKQNYISHALIDQTSITRFIEDNWLGGQHLRSTSFDTIAGSLLDLFDFGQPPVQSLLLDPATGTLPP